jgi:hypothetical protein
MRRTRKVGGWVLELAGVGLLAWAAFRIAPELGAAVAGLALLAVGFVIYDDRK